MATGGRGVHPSPQRAVPGDNQHRAGLAAALEVSLSLRISREMDASLRRRAAAKQVSPSALVRRLLWKGLQAGDEPVLTARQVEEIARRVLRESA